MTSQDKIARRKLSLLELASELSNVSKACKVMGYSRQQFYEIRRNFQTYGAEGLIDRLPGAKGPHPWSRPWPAVRRRAFPCRAHRRRSPRSARPTGVFSLRALVLSVRTRRAESKSRGLRIMGLLSFL